MNSLRFLSDAFGLKHNPRFQPLAFVGKVHTNGFIHFPILLEQAFETVKTVELICFQHLPTVETVGYEALGSSA